MGPVVFTLLASNIKGSTFQFACGSRRVACPAWIRPYAYGGGKKLLPYTPIPQLFWPRGIGQPAPRPVRSVSVLDQFSAGKESNIRPTCMFNLPPDMGIRYIPCSFSTKHNSWHFANAKDKRNPKQKWNLYFTQLVRLHCVLQFLTASETNTASKNVFFLCWFTGDVEFSAWKSQVQSALRYLALVCAQQTQMTHERERWKPAPGWPLGIQTRSNLVKCGKVAHTQAHTRFFLCVQNSDTKAEKQATSQLPNVITMAWSPSRIDCLCHS